MTKRPRLWDKIRMAIFGASVAEQFVDLDTGRPIGDHGTAQNAIDFCLDAPSNCVDSPQEFLLHWRMGDLTEWPEYYEWLRQMGY